MARGRGMRIIDKFSFGGRIPGGVGLVIALTVACSLTVAFADHALFETMALVPRAVWHGQVWRLLTWSVIESDPIRLIFAVLFYYWFGRDLVDVWGSRRFLILWAAIGGIAAVGTSLVALALPDAMNAFFLGGFAVSCALTVAWGLWFPTRQMRLWFLIPISGRVMAWGTVAVTVILAVYRGFEHYLPHLFAEGAMLAWIFRGTLTHKLQQAKQAATRKTAKVTKRRKAVDYLRVVESHDDDELPPEIEAKIQEIVRGKRPDKPGKPDLN